MSTTDTTAGTAADTLAETVTETPATPAAQEPPKSLPTAQQVQTEIDALRATMTGLEEQASVLIRERPVAAVLAAVGVGYLLARLASRVPR